MNEHLCCARCGAPFQLRRRAAGLGCISCNGRRVVPRVEFEAMQRRVAPHPDGIPPSDPDGFRDEDAAETMVCAGCGCEPTGLALYRREICPACGGTVYVTRAAFDAAKAWDRRGGRTEAPPAGTVVASHGYDWTHLSETDRRFLRSLRIKADVTEGATGA